MSLAPESEASHTLSKPEALLYVPVGLASPLWGLFASAAVTGATWWWMTRWARPQNVEAMFGAAESTLEPEMAALAAPVTQAIEAVVEATPEPVIEAMAEASPEPVIEALIEGTPEPIIEAMAEGPADLEAVAGESAPVAPSLEALAPEISDPVVAAEPSLGEVAAELTPMPKPKKKAPTALMAPKGD